MQPLAWLTSVVVVSIPLAVAAEDIDFVRDVRPCFPINAMPVMDPMPSSGKAIYVSTPNRAHLSTWAGSLPSWPAIPRQAT